MPNGLFGLSVYPVLETCVWRGRTLQRDLAIGAQPIPIELVLLGQQQYLGIWPPATPGDEGILALATLPSQEPIDTRPRPRHWIYSTLDRSRSGRYAGVTLQEDLRDPPSDYHFLRNRLRVGVLNTATRELRWAATLVKDGVGRPDEVTVSEDGAYVAVGGWGNMVAMVDVAAEQVLWALREQNRGDFVAFSADGSTLYAAETGRGYVYAMRTRDGAVLQQWCASKSGQPEHGHLATCLAISPDDAWLAVGTGPRGLIFVWNLRTHEPQPVILPHGLTYTAALSFPPDSRYLASMAGGTVKVWAMTPEA